MGFSWQKTILVLLISTSSFVLAYSTMSNMEASYFLSSNTTLELRKKSQSEALSYPVAVALKSRRLVLGSPIHEYVRAENSSASPPPSAQSSSPARRKKNTRRKLKIWALGFSLGTIAGIITGVLLSILYKIIAVIRSRKKRVGPTIFSPLIKNPGYLSFLENEDEVRALEVIGGGVCGIVYKAPLQSDEGILLAIKKIPIPAPDSGESVDKYTIQMRSEIDTVGRVRHKNIVPLLAHVVGNECHYLVYEFMKNGSLHDALQDEGRRLEWAVRYNIAKGIASGLEYIHSHQRPRIFHRDLKPANILLDANMEARIGDFGLAKIITDGASYIATSHLAGTIGYMDPDYVRTLQFTEKCDIYSFGMIMGVLVTGKQPVDEFFQNTVEFTMVKWIRNKVNSENPSEAIDPKLRGHGSEEEMLLLLKVAYLCTLDDATERPNAKQAREMLSQI